MNAKNRFLLSRSVILFGLLTASTPSYAYLDPATGSLIIQSIVGAVAAIGVALKIYWHKVKVLLTGRKPTTTDIESDQKEASSVNQSKIREEDSSTG